MFDDLIMRAHRRRGLNSALNVSATILPLARVAAFMLPVPSSCSRDSRDFKRRDATRTDAGKQNGTERDSRAIQ